MAKNKLFENYNPESLPVDILFTEKKDQSSFPKDEGRKLCIPIYGYEDCIKKKAMKPLSKLLNPDYIVK